MRRPESPSRRASGSRSPNSILTKGAAFSFGNRRIVLRFVLQIEPDTLEAKTDGTANRCILRGLAEREGFYRDFNQHGIADQSDSYQVLYVQCINSFFYPFCRCPLYP